ncbi:MAG TPA: GYD domain-containing protein [Methylomirabilota bacterium]|jgi:uncharacterized protein with GYD domain
MALYMAQFAYTADAWAALTKHPENRTAAVQALAQKLGCRLEALYYSFGEYDGFVILEAPDETTVTAFILAALAPGHIRATRTTPLMRPDQVVEALKKAGTATFKGPAK